MKLINLIIYINLLITMVLITPPVVVNSSTATKSTIVYKYFDAKGVLHLSNKPPKSTALVLYARSYLVQQSYQASPIIGRHLRKHRKYNDYASLIEVAAHRASLPPALLHAVVQVESDYNPTAVSSKGAVGLMQLMPAVAKRYGVTDRTEPVANLNGGAQYLRDLLTMFNGEIALALAAYNAGANAVKRYGNTIPPYQETRSYVKKVKRLYNQDFLVQPLTD